MSTYKLTENSKNYAKALGSFWKYNKEVPSDNITDSEVFRFSTKLTGRTPAAVNTKNVEIAVPLKLLSNYWRTLEMP